MGIIFSMLAGVLTTLQGVFNTRLSDKIGLWETSSMVHAVGLIFSLLPLFLYGNGTFKKLGEVNKLYLTGGILGVLVVFSVMKGISLLGAAFSVSVMLITQLLVATAIDVFGIFGSVPIKFHITKLIGILIMITGIIVFKLKG